MTANNQKGLTFIETVIAVAIFTVMIGSLFEVFSLGKMFWVTQENKITVQREVRQALTRMGKELREASNVVIAQGATSATISFTRQDVGDIVYQWSSAGGNAQKILRTLNAGTSTIVADNISLVSASNDSASVTLRVKASKNYKGGRIVSYELEEKVALR